MSSAASALAPSSPGLDDRLARVRFRRAVALLVMTLLAPGSAQLVVGRKQVGRFALRIWLASLGTAAAAAVLGMVFDSFVFWLVSSTVVLGVIRVVLMALAVGWALLFIDAWRLGRPLELLQRQRLAMVGINGFLCFTVAGTLLFASHVVGVQRDFITTMFTGSTVSEAENGRYNVLLLGGDSGADRFGLRPDSLTVASIDEDTGHTVLFGLPRNMANFPFPDGSQMQQHFPDGFDCEGCYLNGLSTWAADHPGPFRKYDDPGVEATIQGVEGITGLDINYYAMINLAGFRSLVDAVGGVELKVRDRIPIGGVGAPVTGYIEPGVQRLDGFQTLWFARSREGADDYSRMARQKCVMGAMLRQLSPKVVVTKFREIARASEDVISTNLPRSELDRFMALALKAKSQPLSTVSFVPPLVNTADPDVTLIQERVQKAIEKSEARGEESPATKPRRPKRDRSTAPATTGGSIGSMSEGYAANDAANLASAC
ncbi:MAG: Cell envelope-related transcriptional attenuator [uncultured Nocardioidaceae bacterium]|uniref:Cell envelope-related transcriptional attenuator n=1 Tax=uncultured Nocardioidaceae bacterium TaxID=253824 RepID=A0A6J4LK26_9ACTN|nr:MAG: Cell envelope-related transcriptional attenuator [uncultured Nocardioidaceae bacterium]